MKIKKKKKSCLSSYTPGSQLYLTNRSIMSPYPKRRVLSIVDKRSYGNDQGRNRHIFTNVFYFLYRFSLPTNPGFKFLIHERGNEVWWTRAQTCSQTA
jgi:hypothetical protein